MPGEKWHQRLLWLIIGAVVTVFVAALLTPIINGIFSTSARTASSLPTATYVVERTPTLSSNDKSNDNQAAPTSTPQASSDLSTEPQSVFHNLLVTAGWAILIGMAVVAVIFWSIIIYFHVHR